MTGSVQELVRGDRRELSADLLVAAFAARASDPLPTLTLTELTEVFAQRHGLPGKYRRMLAGLPQRDPEATVLRLVQDLVWSWSGAGLAQPLSASVDDGNTRIVLSLRGGEALRAGTGATARERVRSILDRADSPRSFVD
jgi:hypothetical protein